MFLSSIVDSIPIPLPVARSLVVEGKHTARDLSYALTIAFLAGQREEAEDGNAVAVGDNALRFALGRSRSSRRSVENGRVYRMLDTKLTVEGMDEPVALPSLEVRYWSSGAPIVLRKGIRVAGDAQQQWHIDPALADAMRDEDTVDLPFTLLQGAKHKSTVPVMLRLLAWIVDADPSWVKNRENRWTGDQYDGGHLVLQVPYPAILESLALPAKSKPAVVMARMLEPAAREITALTGYGVKFTEVRTVYRPNADGSIREGRLQAIRVEIDIPLNITQPARPVARKPGQPWKPKPKFSRPPKPAELPPAIVEKIREFPEDYDDFDDEPIVHIDTSKMSIPGRRFGSQRKQGE